MQANKCIEYLSHESTFAVNGDSIVINTIGVKENTHYKQIYTTAKEIRFNKTLCLWRLPSNDVDDWFEQVPLVLVQWQLVNELLQ